LAKIRLEMILANHGFVVAASGFRGTGRGNQAKMRARGASSPAGWWLYGDQDQVRLS
jgi:hypothetical protein